MEKVIFGLIFISETMDVIFTVHFGDKTLIVLVYRRTHAKFCIVQSHDTAREMSGITSSREQIPPQIEMKRIAFCRRWRASKRRGFCNRK